MTIVAALKQNSEIWMAADRQTTFNYDFARDDSVNGSKIVTYKHALIATSGLALYKNALKYYAATDKKAFTAKFDTDADVMDFFFKFHGFMKEKYGLGNAKNDEVEKLSYNSFLVVTESLIYQVSCARDVATYENFTAIGNGAEIALGAMHVLRPILNDQAAILEKAVSAGCHFKHGCGGELDLIHVPSALKAKRKRSVKHKPSVKLVSGK